MKAHAMVALAALLAAPDALAQSVRPAALAATCTSCHGPALQGSGAVPKLTGQSADDLTRSLAQIKSGERPTTVMGRLAKGYSDEQIAALAAYISRLP